MNAHISSLSYMQQCGLPVYAQVFHRLPSVVMYLVRFPVADRASMLSPGLHSVDFQSLITLLDIKNTYLY
jgi:hypothetical protein